MRTQVVDVKEQLRLGKCLLVGLSVVVNGVAVVVLVDSGFEKGEVHIIDERSLGRVFFISEAGMKLLRILLTIILLDLVPVIHWFYYLLLMSLCKD